MKFKRYLLFAAIPLLFGATFSLQLRLDGIKKGKGDFETLLYLPSGRFLKPAALGFDELLADFLWVKAVTYFGGHLMVALCKFFQNVVPCGAFGGHGPELEQFFCRAAPGNENND